ncbi:MAG: YciI family protein [Methyloligellaceae bacterium]
MSLISETQHVFVVDLEYLVPLEKVEPHLEAHRNFLKENYAANNFLMSGAKVPRTGGVIIAVSDSRTKLENILKEDPFSQHGLARYTITEFLPAMTADGLSQDRA